MALSDEVADERPTAMNGPSPKGSRIGRPLSSSCLSTRATVLTEEGLEQDMRSSAYFDSRGFSRVGKENVPGFMHLLHAQSYWCGTDEL